MAEVQKTTRTWGESRYHKGITKPEWRIAVDFIANASDLQCHINALIDAHPIYAEALRVAREYPPMHQKTPGFVGLAEIVVSQQISKSAANNILARLWQRLESRTADDPARTFADLPHEEKRVVGLSRPKIRYLDGIADACLSGELESENLANLDNATLIKTLTALPGLGRWSAEIYALFVLQRSDVFPAGDLALQEAYRRLLKQPDRPNEKTMRNEIAAYAPYRSAAARLLWHYYAMRP